MLHHGFYRHSQIVDTPIYQRYGDAIANGQVPYRDFQLEYPPAALPVFALPSLLRSDDGDLNGYRDGFEAEMLVCGALALALHALDPAAASRPGRLRTGGRARLRGGGAARCSARSCSRASTSGRRR